MIICDSGPQNHKKYIVSLMLHGYVNANSHKYIVWVEIIYYLLFIKYLILTILKGVFLNI